MEIGVKTLLESYAPGTKCLGSPLAKLRDPFSKKRPSPMLSNPALHIHHHHANDNFSLRTPMTLSTSALTSIGGFANLQVKSEIIPE